MYRTRLPSAMRGWQVRCAQVALVLLVGGSEVANGSPIDATVAPGHAGSGMFREVARPVPATAPGAVPGWIYVPPCQVSEGIRAGRMDATNRGVESGRPLVPARGLEFQRIADLDGMYGWVCGFGDTDHDNQREIIAIVELAGTFEIRTRYFEEQGGNHYAVVQDVPYYYPFATGDLDGDGLSEVVSQWGNFIQVYESSSPTGYPDHLSWQSPPLINVIGYPTIGDTDGDGLQEIIHSWNPFFGPARLLIFENRGNDNFQLVYDQPTSSSIHREKAVADIDGDGRPEICVPSDDGTLHLFEASANDTWAETASIPVGIVATAVKAGPDVDANGRPEIHVSGSGPLGWTTQVYEATGNDAYTQVSSVSVDDGYFGHCYNVVADLDGDGHLELMMSGGAALYAFKWGLGWRLVARIDDPDGGVHSAMFGDDLNRNGRTELVWQVEELTPSSLHTLVYEIGSLVAVSDGPGGPRSMTILPNPSRGRSEVRLGVLGAREGWLETSDVLGRLRTRVAWTGSPARWDGSDLPVGIYWIRVVDAAGAVLGRTRVVKLNE